METWKCLNITYQCNKSRDSDHCNQRYKNKIQLTMVIRSKVDTNLKFHCILFTSYHHSIHSRTHKLFDYYYYKDLFHQ